MTDERRLVALMTDTDRIAFAPPPRNEKVRIFCATRLNWKRPVPAGFVEMDYKGSDTMIRGLGIFMRENPVPLDIRLVRKGLHVRESIDLVREEELESQVTWLDEMSQGAVLEEFRAADILFEQLDRSHVGMAGMDGMATGRPLIANGHPELTEKWVGEPSPICQARTPREVADQLKRLVFDPAERERVGRQSRRYVEAHFSADSCARRIVDRMRAAGVA